MSSLDWASLAHLPGRTGQNSPLTWASSSLTTSSIVKKAWSVFHYNLNRLPEFAPNSGTASSNLYFVYLKMWEIWTPLKSETSRMLVGESLWSIQSTSTFFEEIPQMLMMITMTSKPNHLQKTAPTKLNVRSSSGNKRKQQRYQRYWAEYPFS